MDAISHAFYHPDHFIKSGIYELSDETRKYVRDKVRKFEIQDIISMLELIGDQGIDRGSVGQTIEIIVANIDKGFEKLTKILQNEDTEYYVEQYAEWLLAYQYPDYYKVNIYKIKERTTEFSGKYISNIEQYGGVFLQIR